MVTIAAFDWRIRRPLPELRLSTEGIEGAFGLIRWEDTSGAELLTRLHARPVGVVVRLRPRARLASPVPGFAKVGKESQRVSPDQLRLETRHLELTPQELQIAHLVADGLTNRQVAAQLFLSPRTIDFHLGNLFRKLGISSRTELARLDLGASRVENQAIPPVRA